MKRLCLLLCLISPLLKAQTPADTGSVTPFKGCNAVLFKAPKGIYATLGRALTAESYLVEGNREFGSLTAAGRGLKSTSTIAITLQFFVTDSTALMTGSYGLFSYGRFSSVAQQSNQLINKGIEGSPNLQTWSEVERLVGLLGQALHTTQVRYLSR